MSASTPRQSSPTLDALEPRLLLSAGQTYIVDSLLDVVADDGLVTLREAIEAANTNQQVHDAPAGSAAETDTIAFALELFASGPESLALNGAALSVTGYLVIEGPGADLLSIDGGGQSRVFELPGARYCRMEGLTVTNGYAPNGGAGIHIEGNVTLSLNDCVITNNIGCGVFFEDGGALYSDGTSYIRNHGTACFSAFGYYNVKNSHFWGNHGRAIYVCCLDGSKFSNSTFVGNTGGGIYNEYTCYIDNCTFVENSGASLMSYIFGVRDSIIDDVSGTHYTSGANLIGVDPGFVRNPSAGPDGLWGTPDDDYGDLRLAATSPAIDMGIGDYPPEAVDALGQPRVFGDAVDFGAYERQEPPAPGRHAQSLTVTTTDDVVDLYDGEVSLREALLFNDRLSDADTVTFAPELFNDGPATIHLGGAPLVPLQDLVLDGPGAGLLTIDAGGMSQILRSPYSSWDTGAPMLSLAGLTLIGGSGNYGGAVYAGAPFLSVYDCVMRDNAATHGGAIYATKAKIVDSVFLRNSAERGGAVEVRPHYTNREIDFIRCSFFGNSALRGGALAEGEGSGNVSLHALECLFVGNTASESGGVIYGNDFTLEFCTLAGNLGAPGSYRPEAAGVIHHTVATGDLDDLFSSDIATEHHNLLSANPQFVRNPSPGPDAAWGTTDDDYGDLRLRPDSPAIDAGDAALLPVDAFDLDHDGDTDEPLPIDAAGFRRVIGSQVDIGAYERAGLGDFNLDGAMNGLDIPGFKSALADTDSWSAAHGVDGHLVGDFNDDGVLNGLDIPGFKAALAGGAVAAGAPLETTGGSATAPNVAAPLTSANSAGSRMATAPASSSDTVAAWLELQRLRRGSASSRRMVFEPDWSTDREPHDGVVLTRLTPMAPKLLV